MPRNLTASDRSALIRLASTMPAGSPERKAILAGLTKKKAARSGAGAAFSDVVTRNLRSSVPECKNCEVNFEFTAGGPTILVENINVDLQYNVKDALELLAKKIQDALERFNVIVEALDIPFDDEGTIEFKVHGA